MQDILAQIFTHLRMAWRHRWFALVTMAVICLVGAVAVMAMPDTYRVDAKVYVDTQSLLKPALRGLALDSKAGEEAVALMQRTLLLRPNLEKIARATDLDLQAATPADMENLLGDLRGKIRVGQTRRTNIFNISYEGYDPQLAKRVVDAVLNLFLEQSLGEFRKDTAMTQEFIERQIQDYETKLVGAEERLKEFKRQHLGFLPGAASDYISRHEATAQALKEAQLQLEEATNRRNELKRQLDDPSDPSLWKLAGERGTPLDTRIQELEGRLDQLLLKYTDKHPDVVITRRLIEDLQAQKRAALEALSKGDLDAQDPNVANPVFQGLKVALSSAEADVAALKVRVDEYTQRLAKLERLTDEALRVEAEFTRLNRDYGILQKNYQGFVSRREQAEIGYEADQSGGNMIVRVIEPPRVPILPTGPKRELLSMTVLLFAIGAGAGLAWLFSLINPVFLDIGQLAAVTGRPVLGAVSFAGLGRFAGYKAELVTFVMAFVAVLAVYGGLMVLQPVDSEALRGLLAL